MATYLRSIEPDQGPVSAREERRDRRLLAGQQGVQGEDGPSASTGMDLLRLPQGERSAAR
jgi:hypothetical protein